MKLKQRNAEQIQESESNLNRYYFWLKYQRDPKHGELLQFYIEHGGAKHYADIHKDEK
jgi:hypothetical protein